MVRYLTTEQFQLLLQACVPPLRPMVQVAVHTGMRLGELLALTWLEVDLETGWIQVHDAKNGLPRKVPLSRTAREVLSALRPTELGPRVFIDREAKPYSYRTAEWQFRNATRAVGLDGFWFHHLRHTCASWLAMRNASFLAIREILGHKDPRTTLRYAKLAPGAVADAVRLLDGPPTGSEPKDPTLQPQN